MKCSGILEPREKNQSCSWTQRHMGSDSGLDGVLLESFPLGPLSFSWKLIVDFKGLH